MGNPVTTFSPARKERSSLSVAIAGASGSGKTKSALEIAVGLAGPDGRIAVIDTEGRRALHYARKYKFDHSDFKPPYSPERCTQAIIDAQVAGYDVVVFDSASDEYEGEGGMLDIAGPDNNWIKAKAQHKHHLIRHLRGTAGTVIFCLRAEEKVKVEKVNGKNVFMPQGWMPICEKRFMHDMTLSFTLTPDRPGMPRFDLPRKIHEDHLSFISPDTLIDRRVGELLRAWQLDIDPPARPAEPGDKTAGIVDGYIRQLEAATAEADVNGILNAEIAKKQIAWMMERRPDQHSRLLEHVGIARKRLRAVEGDAPADAPSGELAL